MFSPCQQHTTRFGDLCYEWQASSFLDKVALGVSFAWAYVILHAVALMWATRWSKQWQLIEKKPIQTKFRPHREHQDASLLYIYQRLCGGSLSNLAVFAAALLSSPWLVPASYHRVVLVPSIANIVVLTLSIDFIMYLAHYATHSRVFKQWSGHYEHHKIISPTSETAVIGSLRESLLLVWLSPILTMNLFPFSSFSDGLLAMAVFQFRLTEIHHDYGFVYDKHLHRLGLVTPKTHHVHHLRQGRNLGHVCLWWDMLGGTYLSWEDCQRGQNKEQSLRAE